MLHVQTVSPVKVEDNFLTERQFKELQEWFVNSRSDFVNCPWMYCPYVIGPDGDHPDDFQFIHLFWFPNRGVVSEHINVIAPIMQKINPSIWVRIKANCRLKTDKVRVGGMHTDVGNYGHTTSIFYINTNDGCTTFENGDTYKSVENRLITFPSHLRHAGSTPSNTKARFVINFNYFQ
jgi:hypothetical protein|tara:strand:+ start:127 stop:660 length:534 start_codon:yes stop_codon:yes gene_type:complete